MAEARLAIEVVAEVALISRQHILALLKLRVLCSFLVSKDRRNLPFYLSTSGETSRHAKKVGQERSSDKLWIKMGLCVANTLLQVCLTFKRQTQVDSAEKEEGRMQIMEKG